MSVALVGPGHAVPHQADPAVDTGGFCSTIARIVAAVLGALSILGSYLFLDPLSATVVSGIIALIGFSMLRGSGAAAAPAQRTNAAYQNQQQPVSPSWWHNINPSILYNHVFNPLTAGGMMGAGRGGGHAVPGQRGTQGTQGGHALPGQRGTQGGATTNAHVLPGHRGTHAATARTGHALPGARTH